MNTLTRLKNWFLQAPTNSSTQPEPTVKRRPTIKECIEQDVDTSRCHGVHEFTIGTSNPYVRVPSPSHLRSNTGFNNQLRRDILRVIKGIRLSGVEIQLEEDSEDGYPKLIVN